MICPSGGYTQVDWNFTTVDIPGLNGRSYSYPRGFVLGGSTSVSKYPVVSKSALRLTVHQDTLAYNRGSRDDWDRYAKVTGDDGWSWDSMEQYFFAVRSLSIIHPY